MGWGLLIAVLASAADAAVAEPPAAPEPSPAAAAQVAPGAPSGLIRYDPPFFAATGPNTAMDMVLRLPGFGFDAGAQVRGFAGAAGNVLIDGERPTAKQDNLQAILTRIPASQVDHIDVIRGGAPGIDMQGRTVLANVVLKKGAGVTAVVALADMFVYDGRNLPDGRFELTRKWDGHTLELSLVPSLYEDDGVGNGPRTRTDPAGAVLIRSFTKAHAGGAQGTATAAYEAPLLGGKLRLNGSGYYQGYDDDEDDRLSLPSTDLQTLRDRKHLLQTELGAHFEARLGRRASLELIAIQQLNRQTYRSAFTSAPEDDLFGETDTSRESILRSVVRLNAGAKLTLEASAEGAYNTQTSDSAFSVNAADVPLPAAHVTVSETRGELAGVATWRPAARLTVEAGLRTEVSAIASRGDVALSKTLVFPKPRAILTYSADARTQLRLRIEREVGQLNFADFVASSALGAGGVVHAGNPDLNPQDAWTVEAAVEKHVGAVVAVVTLRRQWISDVVDRAPIFSPGGVFDAPGNIGDARETDLDLNLTVPLDGIGLKHVQVRGLGTLRHSEVRDPTTGEPRRISGQHPYDFELHLTHDVPRWRLNWGLDLYNRWTETYFRFDEIDVYALKTYVGGFVEYKPRPGWSLRIEGGNLAARGFERILKVYGGPRDHAGLSYVDDRRLQVGPALRFRIRRAFS